MISRGTHVSRMTDCPEGTPHSKHVPILPKVPKALLDGIDQHRGLKLNEEQRMMSTFDPGFTPSSTKKS
jgi:hypothetical protein